MRDPTLAILQPGARFHDRYCVVRCINAGGMGAVYEVVDEKTESPRALKVILPELLGDAEVRSRFELEAKVTGHIQSEHIIRITDAGVDDATTLPFLVMDLLDGQDLGAIVDRRGPLPADEVVLYLSQAALGLDKTHAAGIVHRDLKPENLFVIRRDDGSPCLKVLDFGIAKVIADSSRAQQTRTLGTPLYMSPEQIQGTGSIGPSADVYALGHIAYTLLVGESFWSEEADQNGALYALMTKIMIGTADAPSARARRRRQVTLPPAFDAWFRGITAAEPGERFERASLAVRALADALGVTIARASRPSSGGDTLLSAGLSPLHDGALRAVSTPVDRISLGSGSRGRRIAGVALAVAVLLLGGAAVLVSQWGSPPRAAASGENPGPPARARAAASVASPPKIAPGATVDLAHDEAPGAVASGAPALSATAVHTASSRLPVREGSATAKPPATIGEAPRPTASPAPRPAASHKDEGIY